MAIDIQKSEKVNSGLEVNVMQQNGYELRNRIGY